MVCIDLIILFQNRNIKSMMKYYIFTNSTHATRKMSIRQHVSIGPTFDPY
jgi:hypothetical protein